MISQSPQNSVSCIHVDYVASKIALLYEKIRRVIDYQEEHLLRENAIERSIRRRLLLHLPGAAPEPFARDLIEELIRGGYFPNDTIPETHASVVQAILDRYIELLPLLHSMRLKDAKRLDDFLYGIAACEIEEFLDPPSRELLLLEFEYETLKNNLRIFGAGIKEEEKDILLFIACNQTLLRADERRIYFRLMQKIQPQWFGAEASETQEFAQSIESTKSYLDSLLHHAALRILRNRIKHFAIIFQTISDISANDPERLRAFAKNPQELSRAVQSAYNNRFYTLKEKLKRASFRSVVSIFFSKILIALAAEVPFEIYLGGGIVLQPLILSILFPPLIMLFIVWTIRLPPSANAERLASQIASIINGTFAYEPIEVRSRRWKSSTFFVLRILYFAIFALSMWGIISGLRGLDFSILSILIFLVFLSLIIFSATRLKQWASELNIGPQKEGIGEFLFDTISLPIVSFGKILAGQISRMNIVILLLNLLLEAPIQSFIQFIEAWRKFIREKKEEL